MKSEVIIGVLIGWMLFRWFSGQSIVPSFTARDEMEDSETFPDAEYSIS